MKYDSKMFIRKVLEKFPEREFSYDYSLVDYVNSKTKVSIICKSCGVFNQEPCKHLQGRGCPNCRKVKPCDVEDIALSLGFTEVDLSSYTTVRDYVNLKCSCGHVHYKQVRKLLEGCGCPKCCNTKSKDKFLEESRNVQPQYDYSKAEYKNSYTHVEVICKKHGSFLISPTHLLSGQGCKDCALSKSSYYNITLAERHKKEWIKDPCNLYILDYGGFYKIGISNNLEKRVKALELSYKGSVKVVESWESNKYLCVILENHILKILNILLVNHAKKFEGYTETFYMEDEGMVSDLITYIDYKIRENDG